MGESNPPADQLLVNIPEYRLHVFEEGKEVWSMKVVVGATATHTVIFSGELSQIAFAPIGTYRRASCGMR